MKLVHALAGPAGERRVSGEILARGLRQTGPRRLDMKLSLFVMMLALALATVAGQSAFI